jgi:hypothetical protein
MVIGYLYSLPFHAVEVFRPEQDFLFKSTLTYCKDHFMYRLDRQ